MNYTDVDVYIEEVLELLEVIEQKLLVLEKDPSDQETINTIFRALHTIKGSGSMLGFDRITSFTHVVESVFDSIRNGNLKIDKQIIDLTLSSVDIIHLLLTDPVKVDLEQEKQVILLLARYGTYTEYKRGGAPIGIPQKTNVPETREMKVFRIKFVPSRDIFLRGINPYALVSDLSVLGKLHSFAYIPDAPSLSDLNPEECITSWFFILHTHKSIADIQDVFIFVESYCEIKIDIIDVDSGYDEEADYKKIGEILKERQNITGEELKQILNEKKKLGELLLEKGKVSREEMNAALEEQQLVQDIRKKRSEEVQSKTIRVNHNKLDELVNLVGELVTLQARLSQFAGPFENNELSSITEVFERLTSDLRENTMNLRMVPLARTFESFQRLVRDMCADLDKEVELVVYGADTELDKNVIESLKDPIMHIIRNSMDHGIEAVREREAKGKNTTAQITIGAEYSGANVVITIKDDGRGLDLEKIKQKAVEKGIIHQNMQINQQETMSLIFTPGFSTAEQATKISGRGVGMDVVKQNIEKLRGYLNIESEKDRGTTITIKIPLTLAIIDGLLLEIGENYYIVNLSAVDECIDLTKEVLEESKGREIVKLRGDIIPYMNLQNIFQVEENKPEIEQLVIVNRSTSRIGLKVDRVVGQHQTVIKAVSEVYKHVEEISGATILGDGSVALILDINKLAESVENETNSFMIRGK